MVRIMNLKKIFEQVINTSKAKPAAEVSPKVQTVQTQDSNSAAPQQLPSHQELYRIIQSAHQPDLTDSDIAYPKPLQYVSAKHPREMIKGQAYLLSNIAMQSGLREDDFIRYIMGPVENLAAWVQLLPASENYHHTTIGGLFAHSLDVGLRALKIFENRNLYVEGTAVSREGNLPRFRLACFLAGMLHDIGKIFEDITVVNREGDVWCSQIEPLYVWAIRSKTKDYKIIWRKGRYLESHELYTPYYIAKIIPIEVLKYLSEGDPNVSRILIGCLSSNTADVYGRMSKIIEKADSSSTQFDTKMTKQENGASEYNYPIGLTFVKCLNELVKSRALSINDPDGSFFITEHGAFILWTKKLFEKLDPLLTQEGFPSVDKRLELAHLLVNSSVARVNEVEMEGGEESELFPLWKVRLSLTDKAGQSKASDFFALRITNPQRFFGENIRCTDMLSLLDLTVEDMKTFGSLHGELNSSSKNDTTSEKATLETNNQTDAESTSEEVTESQNAHDPSDVEPTEVEEKIVTVEVSTPDSELDQPVEISEDEVVEDSTIPPPQDSHKETSAPKIAEVVQGFAKPVNIRVTDSLLVSMSVTLRQNDRFTQSYLQLLFELALAQCVDHLSVESLQDGRNYPQAMQALLKGYSLSDEANSVAVYALTAQSWVRDTENTALSIGALTALMGGRTDTVAKTLEILIAQRQARLVKLKGEKFVDVSVLNYRNLVSDSLRKISNGETCEEAILFENVTKFLLHSINLDFMNHQQDKLSQFDLSTQTIETLEKLVALFEGQKQPSKPVEVKQPVQKPSANNQSKPDQILNSDFIGLTTMDMVFESLRAQVNAQRGPWIESLREQDGLFVLQASCFDLMARDYPTFTAEQFGKKLRANPGFLGFRLRGTQVTYDPNFEEEENDLAF